MPRRKLSTTLGQRRKQKSRSRTNENNRAKEYEIERIDNHRVNKEQSRLHFLVKWKGYDDGARTWESFDMFAYDAP